MRAREFTQEMQTTRGGRPRVYLDMDGVLADFFAEWAKLAGVESGSYRDIPPAKVDPTLNKMIGTDFFQRLPKFPTADALVSMIVKQFGGYSICSSPLRGDHENSAQNKRVWIQNNLDPQPDTMEFTGRKEKFARQKDGTPNILIDDRGSNITRWEEAGGIGIKYQADEDGLDVIRRGLVRAERIISGQEKHQPQKLQSLDRSQVMSTGDDLTPDSIHDLADQRGVPWDNDAEFMAQSQRLTGKRHLDDMTPMELARIRAWLKSLPIKENFADGKKPGRKGLAKRVGVDCRQPVSKLRSIAAASSGERQRMAHWCANMKSGRKHK